MKNTFKNDVLYDDIPTITVYLKGTPLGDMIEAQGRVLPEPPPGYREEQGRKIAAWEAEVAALPVRPNPRGRKLFEAVYQQRAKKALADKVAAEQEELPF